ncbi:MAG: NUDIX hydrolase [Pseudomonadota bacterium]
MIRRYDEPVRNEIRYVHRPGAYVILPLNGRLLLTHQAEPIPEFQLPGGGIDPGESPIAALHREVFEETGWRIGYLRRLGAYRRFAYLPELKIWAEKVCSVYIGRPIRRYGPPTEPHHSVFWMAPKVAVDVFANAGDSAFVKRALDV